MVGELSLPLPPYSSYKIQGPPSSGLRRASRPLFMWAREGRLKEIEIPIRTTVIHKAEVLNFYEISGTDLLLKIIEKIKLVKGDFRQEEILKTWQEVLCNDSLQELDFENRLSLSAKGGRAPTPTILKSSSLRSYLIIKAKFSVSSGTYIRSIAHYLGGTLFSLKRAKVGDFDIKDSIKI